MTFDLHFKVVLIHIFKWYFLWKCCAEFNKISPKHRWREFIHLLPVHWHRQLPCPYMVKTLLKSLSPAATENLKTFSKALQMLRSFRFIQMMILAWPFYQNGKITFLCIYMGKTIDKFSRTYEGWDIIFGIDAILTQNMGIYQHPQGQDVGPLWSFCLKRDFADSKYVLMVAYVHVQ